MGTSGSRGNELGIVGGTLPTSAKFVTCLGRGRSADVLINSTAGSSLLSNSSLVAPDFVGPGVGDLLDRGHDPGMGPSRGSQR